MRSILTSFILPLLFSLNGLWLDSASVTDCKPIITLSGSGNLCSSSSVTLTSSEASTYKWSTGATTRNIAVTEPGQYWVETVDAEGCKSTSETVTVSGAPDASVSDPVNYFTFCSYSGNQSTFNLTIENTSATKNTNASYLINWGDGATTTLGKDFETASHTYTSAGSFNLEVTVTGDNGCTSKKTERVFIGSNPSLGLASRGNTNDCAPATFIFDILNTEGNSPQTIYTFQFDDGSAPLRFTHANLPKTIEHTFTESSKGKPLNSFTLSATAENPCGITPATVGGIKISKGPDAELGVDKSIGCVNEPVKLSDQTVSGFNANTSNPNATSSYTVQWKIFPETGWEFVNGTFKSSNPSVKFTKPGDYTIRIVSTPTGTGTKCAADSAQKVIRINELPEAKFKLSSNGNCAPATLTATNTSTGDDLKYVWQVTPATGWAYATGKNAGSQNPSFTFTKAGKYVVSLTASNNCKSSLKDTTITIQDKPIVNLPAQQTYCGPQSITFDAGNAKHAPAYQAQEAEITAYIWQVTGPGSIVYENGSSQNTANPTIGFDTPGEYEVSVVATNACGDSEAATQKITINPLPKLVASSPKSAVCLGESTTISVTGADSYTWAPATGLSATSGNSVTATPKETTTYTITGTNSATGCSGTTTFTVEVNPLPELVVSSDKAAVCQDQDQARLTASGADTYTWSPATGLSATTGTSVLASPTVSTTYTVTGHNASTGCATSRTITVTVNPKPQVNAGEDIRVCNNPVPTQLTASPVGGVWSGAHVTADGTFTPPSETGKYELTYTYTNSLGCTNSDKTVVTVDQAPVANAGDDKVVCLNSGSFNLSAQPAGGTWTGKHVTTNGNFTPSEAGSFILTYTYGTGSCQTTDQVQVTVNDLPTAPLAAGTTICPGFSTTLEVQNPTGSILWYDAATGGKKVGEGERFTTPVLSKTTTYYVETTIEGGCTSTRRAVQVTVRPATPAPVVQPVVLCGTGNKAILVAEGSATSYQWFETESSTEIISSDRTFDAGIVNSSRSYFVQAIINGCISPRTEAKIEVYPVLSSNTLEGVPTICAGQKPTAIPSSTPEGGNANYTYEWESSIESDTEGFTKINGATQKDYAPGVLTRTTWFRRTVKSASCTSTSDAVEVKVTPVISNNTVKTSPITIICENSIADEITGSQPEGGSGTYTYLWEVSTAGAEGPYNPAAGTNNSQNYNPGALAATTWFRRVVASGTCDNHYSQPVKITVYKPISNNSISGEATICEAEVPAVLQGSQPANGDGNYVYRWEMSHDGTNYELATGDNNGINYATGPLTTTTWFRRVVSGGPCGTNVSNAVKVTVNPRIQQNSINPVNPICSGQEAPELNSSQTITGGNGTYTYKWLYSTDGANGNYKAAPGSNTSEVYSPGTLTQTTWYKREVISGACSSVSAAVEVTVNPLPVAPTVNPVTICENSKATLNVVATSGTYRWYTSASATQEVHTGMSFTTPALDATTTYYVESVSTNGCGSPQRAAVTVTVNKNISNNTIAAPAQQPVCAGQVPGAITGTQPENGNGTYTYGWEYSTTGPESGFKPVSNATSASLQPQAITTNTWFRRVVTSSPCSESISQAVMTEVVPVISENSISGAQTICEGDMPATLNGTAPAGGNGIYTYQWQSSTDGSKFTAASGVNDEQQYTAPAALTQSTWYRRIVLSGPCEQHVSAAVKITVQPSIADNILTSGNQAICAGATPASITGTAPKGGNNAYTYTWETSTNGSTYTDAPGTRSNASYQPQALHQDTWFRRKVASGSCESYSAAIKVTVTATIAKNEISESQTICTDTAPQLLQGTQPTGGNGSYTYRWEYSTTGANATDYKTAGGNYTAKDYAAGILYTTTWFRRVVTSGACAVVSNAVKIDVSPVISKNTVTLSQSIYAGQTPAPLTGSAPVGGNGSYTYLWQYSENGTDFMPATAPNTGKNYAPSALTKDTWFRRIVYSGGCEHVSEPVKITVTPAVGNNNIQADQVICFGNTPATLTGSVPAGGEGGYTFIWQQSTSGPDSGWTTATGTSNTQNYSPPALTQHTWFRRIVISGPNTHTSVPVMVTVKPAMSNNKVSTSQTICFNTAPSTLTGTMPTGGSGTYTYLWEISTEGPDKGFTTATGVNNKQDYNSGPLTQTVWLRRMVTSESCERLVSEAIKIIVTPLPKAPEAKATVICAGSKATLTANGNGGRLEWYASAAGGNPIATGNNYTTPVLQHTTSYFVQEVSQSCASERREVKVTVQEPNVSAGPDVTIVKGRSAELQASGGIKYSWAPAETLSNPNVANPTASPEVTTTYTVTVETEGGCTFTDQVTVTVLPHVYIPNTFTPNRDGVNDTWEILNIEKYPNCKVQVFNQWGGQVFVSDGYKQPWDGLQQGKELPIATYYYIIQLERTEKPISGSVTIVK